MAFSHRVTVVLFALVAFLGVVEGLQLGDLAKNYFVVTATLPDGGPITEVQTGRDSILVSWKVNTTVATNATVAKVQAKLCFGKESQILRGWRKTNDLNLAKDKTCLYKIASAPFATNGTFTYKLAKSVPGAKYCVRVYGLDAAGKQVAYGQSAPASRLTNTFTVIPISGRHTSIDVAVGVFSVFSVGSLFTFFIFEHMYLKRKKAV